MFLSVEFNSLSLPFLQVRKYLTCMFWPILFYCIVLYILYCIVCIALYWRGGLCCPTHCDSFQIYCAPPSLGITRTWICRLNFAHTPIFWTPSLKSLPEDLCSGFLRPEKSIDLSWVWTHEPRISRWARYLETTEAGNLALTWNFLTFNHITIFMQTYSRFHMEKEATEI